MRGRELRRDDGGGRTWWTREQVRSRSRWRDIGRGWNSRGNGGFVAHAGKNHVQLDDGWKLVQRRKRNGDGRGVGYTKTDIVQSRVHDAHQQVTMVFISNFSKDVNAKYLFSILGCYGDLQEVVIPARRNCLGKRFEFARFCNVHDLDRFAMKLDNVFTGGEKLFANIPRFQREQTKKVVGNVLERKEKKPVVMKAKQVWKPKVEGPFVKVVNQNMEGIHNVDFRFEAKREDVE